MPQTADIAVIMPHYSAHNYLGEAMASVLGQKNVSLQLFLIDDCSPDESWKDVAAKFRADKRLTVLKTSRNAGPFRIFNMMARRITAPILAFNDSDDYSHPDRFWEQQNEIESGGAGMTGCSFHKMSATGEVGEIVTMPRDVNAAHLRRRYFSILHPTVMLRRSVLDILGGFDGTDHGTGADTDLFLRSTFACKMTNVEKPLYYYRSHGGSLTSINGTSPERKAYAERVYREHKRRCALWRLRFLPGVQTRLALGNKPNDLAFEIAAAN